MSPRIYKRIRKEGPLKRFIPSSELSCLAVDEQRQTIASGQLRRGVVFSRSAKNDWDSGTNNDDENSCGSDDEILHDPFEICFP